MREGEGERGREIECVRGCGSVMFMIIREPSAAGGGAAAMSAPQERTPKQVRVSMWLCVCVCTLKLGSLNKRRFSVDVNVFSHIYNKKKKFC